MIRLLDDLTIDKIAAGEVIERPVSVVKELVENSIDAGATNISVEIKGGGIDYIRVTDNGSGIPYEEVPTAFLRHATSKIVSSEDLFFLNTLGFRGEALASIASVSHVEMMTKSSTDLMGTRIMLDGGNVKEYKQTGTPEGTTIIVKDLFFNVPARKKFLNSPSSEGTKIIEMMEELVLCNPKVAIQLIINGNVRLQSNGSGNIKDIIYRIYGKEVFDLLLPLDYEDDFIKISGFITKPEACRPTRSGENYFINERFVKNDFITRGIEEGYRNFLMQHKFPFVVLFIKLDSFGLDINVHPAKSEIRITNGEFLVDIISKTIKKQLSESELIPSAFVFKEEKKALERQPEPFETKLLKNEYVIKKGYDTKTPLAESMNAKEVDDKSKEFQIDFTEETVEEPTLPKLGMLSQGNTIQYKSKSDLLAEKMQQEEEVDEIKSINDLTKDLDLDNKDIENSESKVNIIEEALNNDSSKENKVDSKEEVENISLDKDESLKSTENTTDEKSENEVEESIDITKDLKISENESKDTNVDAFAEWFKNLDDVDDAPDITLEDDNEEIEEIRTGTQRSAASISNEEAILKNKLSSKPVKVVEEIKPINKIEPEEEKTIFTVKKSNPLPAPQNTDKQYSYEPKVAFRVKTFDSNENKKIENELPKKESATMFKKVDRFGDSNKKESKPVEEQTVIFTEKTLDSSKLSKFEIIGQVFNTYWLISIENELLIMDQHAAHEKVLFEKFMEKFKTQSIETQTLVVAQVVSLGKAEIDCYMKYKEEFEKFGFIINDFGDRDLFIRGVPADLFGANAKDLFMDILSELINVSPSLHIGIIEDRIATRACKAAIKGNQKISKDECQKLLEYMFKLENPYQCPHGRPTLIRITKSDLEKMFKRIL